MAPGTIPHAAVLRDGARSKSARLLRVGLKRNVSKITGSDVRGRGDVISRCLQSPRATELSRGLTAPAVRGRRRTQAIDMTRFHFSVGLSAARFRLLTSVVDPISPKSC